MDVGRREELVRSIDHTLLKQDATPEAVDCLCAEALQYGFGAVCVSPLYVPRAKRQLRGSDVQVATVVGFPHGTQSAFTKAAEARDMVAAGADELDMVMAVGPLKAGDHAYVLEEIRAVVRVASGSIVKVILETALLADDEKRRASEIALEAGAHFVKTSTGFAGGGATVEDVTLLRKTVGERAGVKASGGIRDAATLLQMVEAGANRIGTSSGVAIVRELAGAMGM